MPKRRRLLLLSVGAALVLAAVVWAVSHEREPTYEGRKLSEWADQSIGKVESIELDT